MGLLTQINHLLNFAMPALVLAAFLVATAWWRRRKKPTAMPLWGQFSLQAVLGMAVLGGGLWIYGVDGKMATYAALAVVAASVQWAIERAWRP
jgi:hypothetical protein